MNISTLSAISPVDGRYRKSVEALETYFSEGALIRYRTKIEVEYFIALCELKLPNLNNVDKNLYEKLRLIYKDFSLNDAEKVKQIEKITNHDVKAVEYFLKEQFDRLNLGQFKEFIHFGLTSQDINNTAVPLSLKEAYHDILSPIIEQVIENLKEKAEMWKEIPMLARTHGQPASPTILSTLR